MSGDVSRYRHALLADPALCDRILRELPPAPAEPERVIRCCRENAERAVCRAVAPAAVRREVWRIQLADDQL